MVKKLWNSPTNMINNTVDDRLSQYCLFRPYFGRRRVDSNASGRKSMLKSISLRNYPLHIDQMEVLGLPAYIYASVIADGLAF